MISCNKKCKCKTCRICFISECGDCYSDTLEQCKSGNGVQNCRGYTPSNFLKRLWYCITGKTPWWLLK